MSASREREAAIAARLKAATRGPWHDEQKATSAYGTPVAGPFGAQRSDEAPHIGNIFGRANAAFIAHAPEDVAYLLAELGRLRAGRDVLMEALGLACREARGTRDVAAGELAQAVVAWDGAGEDGCSFCDGQYGALPSTEDLILHRTDCPVVVYRLAWLAVLIANNPAPDTPDRVQLVRLATVQERYERAASGGARGGAQP